MARSIPSSSAIYQDKVSEMGWKTLQICSSLSLIVSKARESGTVNTIRTRFWQFWERSRRLWIYFGSFFRIPQSFHFGVNGWLRRSLWSYSLLGACHNFNFPSDDLNIQWASVGACRKYLTTARPFECCQIDLIEYKLLIWKEGWGSQYSRNGRTWTIDHIHIHSPKFYISLINISLGKWDKLK
jgi:hypothetical protein